MYRTTLRYLILAHTNQRQFPEDVAYQADIKEVPVHRAIPALIEHGMLRRFLDGSIRRTPTGRKFLHTWED